MQLISCHNGRLIHTTDSAEGGARWSGRSFVTGLAALDALAPEGRLSRGAVHELLRQPEDEPPAFVALVFAKAISCSTDFHPVSSDPSEHGLEAHATESAGGGAIVWCDPTGE